MSKKTYFFSFIELLFTVAIGFYVNQVLHKPDLALIVWFVGALLVFHRILINISLNNHDKKITEEFGNLRKLIDLDINTKIHTLDDIRKAYMGILEPEFREIKNTMILGILEKLDELLHNKETGVLTSSIYYDWIFQVFDGCQKGDSIKAVSVLHNVEWSTEDPNEIKFFKSNISAAKRGVKLERIFFMDKSLLNESLDNDFIKAQEKGNKYKIKGYFADMELVSKIDKKLQNDVGDGFIIINDKAVLVDIFSENGIAKGNVIMKKIKVNQYIKIYNRLKNSSKLLERID